MDRAILPRDAGLFVARVAMGLLFLLAGYGKITAYAGTVGYMAKLGVPAPAIVTPITLIFEISVGLALILGFQVRLVALAVAAFCLAAAVIAHWDFANANQLNHFLKNIAIAGGAIALHLAGPGKYAINKT